MYQFRNKLNISMLSPDYKVIYTGVIFLLSMSLCVPASAQDASRTLGKALVSKAEEKMQDQDLIDVPAKSSTAPAPIVVPASPALSPADQAIPDDSAPRLPLEILEGIKLPVISNQNLLDKVESDVEAELKRLENAQGKIPSILFTEEEEGRLGRAISVYESGNFIKSTVPDGVGSDEDPLLNVEIVDRNLILGGISFGDGVNWVIWLNKQRLTPTRLPAEVKYVKVYKDHVDLKWLDKLTGELIPVRLRPNQRFNLDGRSFLPG